MSQRGLDSSRLSMHQLSSSLTSDSARRSASLSGAAGGSERNMFSPDIILRLRSAVDELESSHLDSSRSGLAALPVEVPSDHRAGREKSKAKRGLAAEVAAAAAAAASQEDFTRWGYRSGQAVVREKDAERSADRVRNGHESEANDRGSDSVRQFGGTSPVHTVQEQVLHDQDIMGMRAMLSAQQVECDGLTRAVQSVRNSVHRSEALVAEELRALRSNLDYQLLPAYRQELEREMVVHSEGASEASPWATQACVAIRFLYRVLEEERGCHAELSRHVADLHRQVSVLGHKCATLQEGADDAARAAESAAGAATQELVARDLEIEQMQAHITALKAELSREYVDKIQLLVSAQAPSARPTHWDGDVDLVAPGDDGAEPRQSASVQQRGARVTRAGVEERRARSGSGEGKGTSFGADGGEAQLRERYDRLLGVGSDKVKVRLTTGGGGGVARGWIVPKRKTSGARMPQREGGLREHERRDRRQPATTAATTAAGGVKGARVGDAPRAEQSRAARQRAATAVGGGLMQEKRGGRRRKPVEEPGLGDDGGAYISSSGEQSAETWVPSDARRSGGLEDAAGNEDGSDDEEGVRSKEVGQRGRRSSRNMVFASVPTKEGRGRKYMSGDGHKGTTRNGFEGGDAYSSLRRFLENEAVDAVRTSRSQTREARATSSRRVIEDTSSNYGRARAQGTDPAEQRLRLRRRGVPSSRLEGWGSSDSSRGVSELGESDTSGGMEDDSLDDEGS